MILYHLEKWKYKDVWPPEGTLHADGRWNAAGQWIIYTSSTISLAKLEVLANENSVPIKRVCIILEVADSLKIYKVNKKKLPSNWMDKPSPNNLTLLTAEFLKCGKLIMQVPSAQSYTEYNYLINVRHSQFHQLVNVLDVREEPFDARLK